MKFSKIIGKIDEATVAEAERRLTKTFLELGLRYDNPNQATGLGGDPLIFSLIYPIEHIATVSMPTAATDGKRYYWNPYFVLGLSPIGLRIVAAHEAWHAIYMHPSRRGSRHPRLWNIAVDYIVNGTVMEDFKARGKDPKELFTKNLGKFIRLKDYAEFLKDPFNPPKSLVEQGFVASKDEIEKSVASKPKKYMKKVNPNDAKELTEKEIKEMQEEAKVSFFFADPDLEGDFKRPEKIYEYLLSMMPKCPSCGSIGHYNKPNKSKQDKNKGNQKNKGKGTKDNQGDQGSQDEQNQGSSGNQGNQEGTGDQQGNGQGQSDSSDDNQGSCGNSGGGCGKCGDGFDVFGMGGLVDDHMDTEESEEKIAGRIADAIESAKRMQGYIPAGMEDELGKLTAPKVNWQDFIRNRLTRARDGNGRNNWNKFRTRPLYYGHLVPKRKSYTCNFVCLLDTSGSMTKEDMTYGISQLQSLDERAEGWIVPGDGQVYFDQATKIKKASSEELNNVKVVGRGGTYMLEEFSNEYEKHFGKTDLVIIITDSYVCETDLAGMIEPDCPVAWILTQPNDSFSPPFGKVFNLYNM